MKKVVFTNYDIEKIKDDYLIKKLSCSEIGKEYKISKQPINRLLKDMGILRGGNSDGKKIHLTRELQSLIKEMYLDKKNNCKEIARKLNMSESLIDKILQNSGFRRTKSDAMSVLKTGKKLKLSVRINMKNAQQKLSKSGKRKQSGGVCKKFIIEGLECQGTYEKFYIEKIIKDGGNLPEKATPIVTPYGIYYPDFIKNKTLIEIKSDYTYEVLVGNKNFGSSTQKENRQLKKIRWINANVMTVDVLVVNKKNNTIIKKEIV
jgi:predicted DNA-binding protein YlxM (UPF0122 family)